MKRPWLLSVIRQRFYSNFHVCTTTTTTTTTTTITALLLIFTSSSTTTTTTTATAAAATTTSTITTATGYSKKKFRNTINHQVSNSFGPDQDQHLSWSGSKLFAKVISRRKKSLFARKEVKKTWQGLHPQFYRLRLAKVITHKFWWHSNHTSWQTLLRLIEILR